MSCSCNKILVKSYRENATLTIAIIIRFNATDWQKAEKGVVKQRHNNIICRHCNTLNKNITVNCAHTVVMVT